MKLKIKLIKVLIFKHFFVLFGLNKIVKKVVFLLIIYNNLFQLINIKNLQYFKF